MFLSVHARGPSGLHEPSAVDRVFRTESELVFLHEGIACGGDYNFHFNKSLILAVRRTQVIHEPCCTWQSSPQVPRSSVVRASHRCT